MKGQIPKFLYGVSYGLVLALTYHVYSYFDVQLSYLLFFQAAATAATFHAVLKPRLFLEGLRSKLYWIRGALYCLTQYLLFHGQHVSSPGTMMTQSVLGGMITFALAAVILREKVTIHRLGGLMFSLVGAAFLLSSRNLAVTSVAGGVSQALATLIVRNKMKTGARAIPGVSQGFVATSVLLPILHPSLLDQAMTSFDSGHLIPVFVSCTLLCAAQYGYFVLLRLFEAQRASIFALTRVPWGICLDTAVSGIPLSMARITAALLIFLGSVVTYCERLTASGRARTKVQSTESLPVQ